MASTVVDFNCETHQLEKLIVLGQSKRIDNFYSDGKSFMKKSESPAAKLALSCVVQQLLTKGTPTHAQAKRLESTFLMEKSHTSNLYRRQIKKEEN